VPRKYELKARARRQAETRRRIVEAAIELHRTKGPARTTLSEIARLAGVQRHTLYRHFRDEREVGLACSGLYMERHPPPDPEPWRALADPEERLRLGLLRLYAWFEQVQDMIGAVLRDAEVDPLTREMLELRSREPMARIRDVLSQGLPDERRVRAVLGLALDFYAWRRLRDSGLAPGEAAELMADMVLWASSGV